MGFKIGFHSTLANKESKKKLFVTFVGIANYVNLGENGNFGKFSNDKIKAKYSITLQEIFYLEDYHELLNQISSKFYVGGESTWISNRKLDSGLMLSKKILRPSFNDEKHDSGPYLKNKKTDNQNKSEIMNENGDNMDGSQKFDFGI